MTLPIWKAPIPDRCMVRGLNIDGGARGDLIWKTKRLERLPDPEGVMAHPPAPQFSSSQAVMCVWHWPRPRGGTAAPPLTNRWFADSPLEEDGFELAVPPRRERLCRSLTLFIAPIQRTAGSRHGRARWQIVPKSLLMNSAAAAIPKVTSFDTVGEGRMRKSAGFKRRKRCVR
jgi:hypothetical protein